MLEFFAEVQLILYKVKKKWRALDHNDFHFRV